MTAPRYFATPAEWRAWLEEHHDKEPELSVGFWKRDSGKASITWPQSVDEALCFGWIDGVRHRIDDEAYRIRFTPRRRGSIWSQVNIRRFAELKAEGRIAPAGQAAFDAAKSTAAIYSYERPADDFTPAETKQFKANKAAWAYWQSCPPGYRKLNTHRVTTARKPETRARRLTSLVDSCAQGRRIDAMSPLPKG